MSLPPTVPPPAFSAAALPFLTGLWVALLGLAVLWGLRRFYDPVPWRVAAVLGALLVILFAPALLLGRVMLPLDLLLTRPPFKHLEPPAEPGNHLQSDLVFETFPWRVQVLRAYSRGEWPLLDPDSEGGLPLLANPQAQVIQPLTLGELPLPPPAAAAVTDALRCLAALVFAFLLLRRQGLGEAAALVGAICFGLGGFLMLWLGWALANTAAWLPAVLYALVRVGERGGRRDVALLAFTLAGLGLAGHPETVLQSLLLAAGFCVGLLRAAPRGGPWRTVGRWAAAAGIAVALAAPALLPTALEMPHSLRAEETRRIVAGVRAQSWSFPWDTPARRAVMRETVEMHGAAMAAPNAFGNDRFGAFWGEQTNINVIGSRFAGSLAIVGFLVALVPLRRGRGERFPQERYLIGAALVVLVVLLKLPGVDPLMRRIPGLASSLNLHDRAGVLLCFSLAYVAACALERWRRGADAAPGRRLGWLAAAAAVGGFVAWAYLAHPPPEPGTLSELRRTSLAVQLGVVGLGAALLAGTARAGRWRGVVLGVLAVAAASELLWFHRPANPALPHRLAFPVTPEMAFLEQHAGDGRVLGYRGLLPPQTPLIYGLASPAASGPNKPLSYQELVAPLLIRTSGSADAFTAEESPLYDLLGVRWVMAPRNYHGPRWAGTRMAFRGPNAVIWERPRALPRLFLPASLETCAAPWNGCIAAVSDFTAEARVRPGPGIPPAWRADKPTDSRLLGLRSPEPTRWTVRAVTAEPRLLATTLYQDGGWRLVDPADGPGADFPPTLADGPFFAARLPAGDRRIELIYRPPGFLPGMLLGSLGVTALLALAAPRAARPPGAAAP